MYNRYLDQTFQTEPIQTAAAQNAPSPQHVPRSASVPPPEEPGHHRHSDLLGEVTSGLSGLLGSVFKNFSLENFDTGDILLVLIILFLFLEGDNLELVITLGLMLLLGLGDD